MHCAALKGHSEVVRVLTPMNGDVNHQRKDGWTPLHLACWNGHHAMVRELIINKCKVNIRTNVNLECTLFYMVEQCIFITSIG